MCLLENEIAMAIGHARPGLLSLLIILKMELGPGQIIKQKQYAAQIQELFQLGQLLILTIVCFAAVLTQDQISALKNLLLTL